ncbi:MAG: hypothetical protein ABIV50_15230 [Opitutus sp.]
MSERRLWALIVAALTIVAAWLFWTARAPQSRGELSPPTGSTASAVLLRGTHVQTTAEAPGESRLADALNSPTGSSRTDLEIVEQLLETFRTNFPATGNPVGDNIAITAALSGSNRLKLPLIAKSHPAINPRGELCDRWGTPYFFHQLSGTQMEIRSAGPNHRLYDDDDVVMTP